MTVSSTVGNGGQTKDVSKTDSLMLGSSVVNDEKKEDEKPLNSTAASGSATPKKASSPEGSVLPVNMPASMMTPNNRPPSRSSLSVQSAGSTGGRTTTSVSRRGGRTRSRSPTGHIHSYGARPPSATPSVPSEVIPQSPRNPSAAAAAAAAAAKSFRNPVSHPPMHYQQYTGPHSSVRGHPSQGSDPYGRQSRQEHPYASSRYQPGQQRPTSSAGNPYQGQSQPRPPSSASSSYTGGPPPPGYYDPHNGSRNPSHYYNRSCPPPRGYESSQQPAGPDGRPLSRNGGSGDPSQSHPQSYGYNPYHHRSMNNSRGGPPPQPGSGREFGNGSSGTSNARYQPSGPGARGPSNNNSGSGAVDGGEYGRQHHPTNSSSSSRHAHPSHYPGHHSRGGPTPYPSSNHGHHPSYRHGDPNAHRGPPPSHYRGGPPPPSSRGPPPNHPDYHRYHASQQHSQPSKGQGEGAKSTRTVIGTATPLHLNKGGQGPLPPISMGGSSNKLVASSKPVTNRHASHDSRRGSAASVFRGRPGPLSSGPPSNPGGPVGNNPKTILDSLDTPSNSFEEKKSSRGDNKDQQLIPGVAKDQELSPEEPPKIRTNNNSNGDGINFDPQPSPSPPQLTNSLDMAPSFSLFNQSFDSLGDTAQFFNVGSALDSTMLNASTSFELKPSGSRSPIQSTSSSADNYLQLSSSNGTFKLNASMSGGAIFAMSPTNSFGNGPTSSFSTGAGAPKMTQILGGNSDNGRSSPSRVLDMYKSANGGEESDLRLSSSLVGSPMIGTAESYASSRPFATSLESGPPQPALGSRSATNDRRSQLSPRPQRTHQYGSHSSSSQHHYRPPRAPSSGPPNKDGSPRFYNFLRKNRDAFVDVTFLLPKLKSAVMESKAKVETTGTVSNESTPKRGQARRGFDREPSAADSKIARRRIVSAVCAFGGSFTGSRGNPPAQSHPDKQKSISGGDDKKNGKSNSQSIFREKSSEPKTVTPNSSSSSSSPNSGDVFSSEQSKYDGALPTRYYESDNRLSWEFEENPPIGTAKKNPLNAPYCMEIQNDGSSDSTEGEEGSERKKRRTDGKGDSGDSDKEELKEGDIEDLAKSEKDNKDESPIAKMRYRCKLCGQPKTNHICPYQQCLVRNIGVMVHPAVNAFTAAEPGGLAPALSEMNNLAISAARLQNENVSNRSSEISPSRPTPDRSSVRSGNTQVDGDTIAHVTPEVLRSGTSTRGSNEIATPQRTQRSTPGSSTSGRSKLGSSSSRKKRPHGKMIGNAGDQTDLLFVEEMPLKTEQYRTITPSKSIANNPDAFTYPALPLPYAQRKRLSDNLFSLSKEIPQLTDECAAVLREARERDLWDLAVAELMTQVVVVVHCHEGDVCFDGLRRYLLTLGFSC